MADPDYTIAAKGYVPKPLDPLETLQGIERYRILQNQNTLTGLEAKQKGIDVQSLADWKRTRDPSSLEGASPELRTSAAAGDNQVNALKKETIAKDAHYIMNEKDPKIRKYLWDAKREDYVRRGWIPRNIADKYPDPNDTVLENIVRGQLSVPEYRQTTGQTAEAEAAGRAPYDYREFDPNRPVMAPAVRPGGALSGGTPVGGINRRAAPESGPAVPPRAMEAPSNTGLRPPRSQNLTDTNATVVGEPENASRPVPDDNNPYSKTVPLNPIGQELPTGRGVVQPGIDPVRIQARQEGFKRLNDEIAPMATAASKVDANLGTIRTQLESGRASTDKLAEIKNTVAGIIYGVTKDPEITKNLTGMNVQDQEVLNKETTRMGMEYAKNTNGARQAVQALTIELGANPSMLTSDAGNLKVVKIMQAGAKYDKEMSKAAEAYFKKNNHLTGFENWWTTNHPVAQFISKEVPYQVPKGGASEMQNGVTYEFPYGDKKDRNGNPVTFKGTWNAEAGRFDPVK